MAETVLEQILDDLRSQAVTHYPQRGDFKNLRVVGHTPKNDHFIYDVCIDFAEGSERVAIKIYRAGKCGGNAKSVARQENTNLQFVSQTFTAKRKLEGVPRVLGDYSDLCAVVTDKVAGLPVQSIIMKAALFRALPIMAALPWWRCGPVNGCAVSIRPLPMSRSLLTAAP